MKFCKGLLGFQINKGPYFMTNKVMQRAFIFIKPAVYYELDNH